MVWWVFNLVFQPVTWLVGCSLSVGCFTTRFSSLFWGSFRGVFREKNVQKTVKKRPKKGLSWNAYGQRQKTRCCLTKGKKGRKKALKKRKHCIKGLYRFKKRMFFSKTFFRPRWKGDHKRTPKKAKKNRRETPYWRPRVPEQVDSLPRPDLWVWRYSDPDSTDVAWCWFTANKLGFGIVLMKSFKCRMPHSTGIVVRYWECTQVVCWDDRRYICNQLSEGDCGAEHVPDFFSVMI
jgi:hypothetical protein